MVARGWVRSEIRKNVDVHEKTILTVAAAELVFVREALADAEKIDEEVCTMLEHSKAELEALETSGALAEQRYGWPLGANLLRVEAHDRRRAAAQLETRLLSFMVATAYLARWARKTDGYADDVALLPIVKAAIECSTWTERGKPECAQHLEFLNARLQTLEIEPLARDPAATNDGTVMRRCVDVVHTEPTEA